MPEFSRYSIINLESCDERLQVICKDAIAIYDFAVVCGQRNEQQQEKLFQEHKTKVHYPNSKHNKTPSLAVDLVPYPTLYTSIPHFHILAGIMFGIAANYGVELRWGGDWDGDWDLKDQTFFDLPHFEIIE